MQRFSIYGYDKIFGPANGYFQLCRLCSETIFVFTQPLPYLKFHILKSNHKWNSNFICEIKVSHVEMTRNPLSIARKFSSKLEKLKYITVILRRRISPPLPFRIHDAQIRFLRSFYLATTVPTKQLSENSPFSQLVYHAVS